MRSADDDLAAIAAATARERQLIAASVGEPQGPPGDQLAALLDLAAALEAGGIPYALIGGIAVGIHSGTPRATNDVDVAVLSVASESVVPVLTSAGCAVTGTFEHSVNFRHAGGEPVRVAFDPLFDAMIDRSEPVEVRGRVVRLVAKADLITMKERAAGDPSRRTSKALRDRADLALLRGDVPDPDEGW